MELTRQCPICFKFKLPKKFARHVGPCKKCQGGATQQRSKSAFIPVKRNFKTPPGPCRDKE